jgi:long-chain-alcohol oxidase
MGLTPRLVDAFARVVDTVFPAVEGDGPAWTATGSELLPEGALEALYRALPNDLNRRELRLLLHVLSAPGLGMFVTGKARPFISLSPAESADAFRWMGSHPLSRVRAGARALKTLAAYPLLTTADPSHRPEAWAAIGYPGPDGPPPKVGKPIQTITVTGDATLSADVVVVGSGAGGGTAAAVLASAGLDVVVVEAGDYHNESDFTHLEADAYQKMHLDGAMGSTADGGIIILAGATLGGGTVVNYTTSFPTPPEVRAEWDRVAGFSDVFTGDGYESSAQAVHDRLAINTVHSWPSVREQLLERGLAKLGWHCGVTPRNAVGCTEAACGYCTLGCRIGAKQSILVTYLADAASLGVRFVVGAEVRSVLVDNGKASGITAQVGDHSLRVTARAVVLAAGGLHTPAILLRSGIASKAVGRYLRLHPVTAVWGRFDDPVEPWTGVLQARYSDEFVNLDGKGYGFRFETAPAHPLFPAALIGWEDGPSYKRDILGLRHLGVVGVLVRDRDHGRVTLRRDGSARWKYQVSKRDRVHAREGILRGAEVLAAAGATEIFPSTMRPVRWHPGSEPVTRFMERVDTIGYGPNRTNYLSFHQMGSARMGSDPAVSVVDGNNETHDIAGLYVVDASCFPTASGVNPTVSIATIAHRGATRLAERLAG